MDKQLAQLQRNIARIRREIRVQNAAMQPFIEAGCARLWADRNAKREGAAQIVPAKSPKSALPRTSKMIEHPQMIVHTHALRQNGKSPPRKRRRR
jgi:hypothetical protein